MAEAAVESVLQNLQILQTHHIEGTESHIEKLERNILLLQAFLKDSIKKQDANLEELLREIREVVYDAEDVIDALVTQANLSKSDDFETPELARIADVVDSVGCKVKDIYDPEALEGSEAEVEFVLQKLERILTNDKLLIKSSESHIEKLESDLHLFEAFINDPTKKLTEDEELKELLRQMHDLVYDAEDVIDAFMTQTEVNVHGITKVVDSVRDIYGRIDLASPSAAGKRDSSKALEVDVENYAATKVVKGLSKEISEHPVLLTPNYEQIGSGGKSKVSSDSRKNERRQKKLSPIQRLYETCREVFADCGPDIIPSPEKVEKLAAVLDGMSQADLGLHPNKPFSSRERAPIVTYIHIFECDKFSIGIFCLPPTSVIPLHNHPGMTVFSKLLFGTMHVKSYDWLNEANDKKNSDDGTLTTAIDSKGYPDGLRLAKLKVNSEFTAPCRTSILYPADGGNMRCFTAKTACAVLDVLGPPYSDPEGRHCQYYSEFPFANFSVEKLSLGEEEKEGYAWLQEKEVPEDFSVVGISYTGPKIARK